MASRHPNPILHALNRNLWRSRAIWLFERAGPWVGVLVFLAGVARSLSPDTFASVTLPIAAVFCVGLAAAAAWEARRISLGQAASQADYGLDLPDSLSAYVEYASLEQPTAAHQAHLRQVAESYPEGIRWRPPGPRPWKVGATVVLCLFGFSIAFRGETEPPTLSQGQLAPVRKAAEALRAAAARSGDPQMLELAVSLEQFLKMAEPGVPSDIERLLRQLRRIQREMNSSEASLAGEFLGELLQQSSEPGAEWDALGKALQQAKWQKAAELARRLAGAGARPVDRNAEGEILEAFNRGQARAGTSGSPDPSPAISSQELARRLAAVAESLAAPSKSQEFQALRQAQAALAKLAQDLANGGQPAPAGSEPGDGDSPPVLGLRDLGISGSAGRRESVSPLVADGPGAALSTILETQDTGIPTVLSEATHLPEGQAPAGPVARIPVPQDRKELVHRYFDALTRSYQE